jgi:hypothetical protein
MKNWQLDFITFLLLFIIFLIVDNIINDAFLFYISGFATLFYGILFLTDLFSKPKSIEFETIGNDLKAMNYYDKKVKITKKLKELYKKWKSAEDEFYSKV